LPACFEGHTDRINSVCLSGDGRFALSGSSDETLKLWEVQTGRCLRTFEGHTEKVWSVCLSADGRFVLSGSIDKTVKLWEVATGRCLRTFEGHTGAINSVCLSADGRFALSGSSDHTVKLWELGNGSCLRTLAHDGSTDFVDLTPDGQFAVSEEGDTVTVWFLDWELEENEPTSWDEGARPYLEVFLRTHQPYAGTLPWHREPTEEEVTRALTRAGTPIWNNEDWLGLLRTLGCAGYGWLRPEGVGRELERMAAAWRDPQ